MRVIVCGSRTWRDRELISEALKDLPTDSVVVHGGASGADTLAAEVARELGLSVEEHPADWERYGRSAGPIRNREMLASGVDLVIAFRADGPSPGTDHMVQIAKAAGVPVRVVRVCAPAETEEVREYA